MERGELDRRRREPAGLIRTPLLDTPVGALNQAFAWAVRRAPAAVRADPGAPSRWDADDFEDLLDSAEVFHRVGPAAALDPLGILQRVIGGLFGLRADGAGGRFEAEPWVPNGWKSMLLRRLRCHRTIVDLEVRSRVEWVTVRFELLFGPPIPMAVGVRNRGAVAQVTIDETPVTGAVGIFTLSGEHEVTFFLGSGHRGSPGPD